MYKSIFAQGKGNNKHLIHLWSDEGYHTEEWYNTPYKECSESKAKYKGLKGELLCKSDREWNRNDPGLHFHDISAHQKFLIEKYGVNDEPSKTHKELFFDIETEMGDSLTVDYISSAPKKVTSIAWYDKQADKWGVLILDEKGQLKRTYDKQRNKEIIPVRYEEDLLDQFLNHWEEIQPDIVTGWNSDYFDIPYLYYRMCFILGPEEAKRLSPIGIVNDAKTKGEYWYKKDMYVDIAGVESLDYMRLHKKFSWADEPSYKLDAIGEKYAGINKIEYEGNLDRLFEDDIQTFIQYNFRDVEILKVLDEKLQYLALTKNLAHKGKIRYHEVYASSKIHDGAISAYLLSQNIIPPSRDRNPITKKNYAGGYLFCPQAGIFKYMFDEDLTSLYPSIIMSLNIGKETLVGRIIVEDERVVVAGKEIFNCRYGLNDLKNRNPEEELIVENADRKRARVSVSKLISMVEKNNYAISANGVLYRTDKPSVLSTILDKWFDERVLYKNQMKKAYKAGDEEKGASFYMQQYTMKILLNSLYGATALGSFRYGNVILSESITLSGQRIIQESALCANRHMNKVIKGEITL
jgi:DNA polymerase elongation subunit (family B)